MLVSQRTAGFLQRSIRPCLLGNGQVIGAEGAAVRENHCGELRALIAAGLTLLDRSVLIHTYLHPHLALVNEQDRKRYRTIGHGETEILRDARHPLSLDRHEDRLFRDGRLEAL